VLTRLSLLLLFFFSLSLLLGGENGFNQAIELSADALAGVKFIREKKLLTQYFSEIAQETGKYAFGVKDTLQALELGSAEELIVWEQLDVNRIVLKHKETGVDKIVYLTERQEKDPKNFKAEDGGDLEIVDRQTLLEWLAENFKNFGAKLNFVTDKSQEGSQFCRGFGGIGALLRYQVDFLTMEVDEVEDDEDDFI
jgi:peptide chain release factor subunit 1